MRRIIWWEIDKCTAGEVPKQIFTIKPQFAEDELPILSNLISLSVSLLFLVAAVVVADEWSYPALASNGEMTGKCNEEMEAN